VFEIAVFSEENYSPAVDCENTDGQAHPGTVDNSRENSRNERREYLAEVLFSELSAAITSALYISEL
jgi:hypothetical protein